jgi:hypothetical protein
MNNMTETEIMKEVELMETIHTGVKELLQECKTKYKSAGGEQEFSWMIRHDTEVSSDALDYASSGMQMIKRVLEALLPDVEVYVRTVTVFELIQLVVTISHPNDPETDED